MRRLSLRTKQILLLSFVILLPILVFAFVSIDGTLRTLHAGIASEYSRFVNHIGRQVEASLGTTLNLVQLVSELPTARYERAIDINAAMRKFLDRFPRFARFRFLEPDGTLVVEEPPSKAASLPPIYAVGAARVHDSGDLWLAPLHAEHEEGERVLTAFAPNLDDDGMIEYVLAADIDLAQIRGLLASGSVREAIRFAIFDADRRLVAGTVEAAIARALTSGVSQPMSVDYPLIRIYRTEDGRSLVATDQVIDRIGWRLVLFEDEASAFAPVIRFRRSVGLLLAACAALTLLAGTAVANRLTRSLDLLAGATAKLARGDFDVEVDVRSSDEIGDLARSFVHMAGEIQRSQAEIETLNRALAERVKDHYRGIFSSLREGLILTGAEFRVEEFNPAALAVLAVADGALTGRTLPEVLRAAGIASDPFAGRPPAGGEQFGLEFRTGEGRRTDLLVTTVARPGGLLWLLVDVTGLKSLEAQLIQAEKLASLGQLMAGMAHEINNPLTGILGFASVLRSRESEPSRIETLGRIIAAAHRINNIIVNMRQFSSPSRQMMAQSNLNEIVKQSVKLLENEAGKYRAAIALDLGELPDGMMDANQLQQVLTNLILNAFHAIGQAERPGTVRIATRAEGGELVLTVRDDGCGIPADLLAKVFDPFFTTKSDWKGLGLGLSICYTIVNNHGGRIAIDSVEGRTTTVRVALPLVVPDIQVAPPIDIRQLREYAITADPAALPGRILLVDDEIDIRKLFEAFPGGRVTAVATGADALERSAAEAFDLTIVDLRLEDMLGTELILRLREAGRPGRFLVITGCQPDDELVLQARTRAGAKVLHKPFTIQDVIWEIERWSG